MAGQSSVIFLSILDTQSHQVTSALGWRGRPDKGTFIPRTERTNIEKHFTGESMLDRPLVGTQ